MGQFHTYYSGETIIFNRINVSECDPCMEKVGVLSETDIEPKIRNLMW